MKLIKSILKFLQIEICITPGITMEPSQYQPEETQYNPATGYTMIGAMDSGSNTFANNSHTDYSYNDPFKNY